MSFNGSGTFVINSAGQPVVANTVISATTFNALTADLANGLTTCITKDGQTTPTANIPMGGFKITNLANGTAATDAATVAQIQSNGAALVTVTGVDTLLGSLSPALTTYVTGAVYYFVAPATNTGAVTLNIDSLGAKNVTRDGSTVLVAGDIVSGEMVSVVYDDTRFQLISPVNSFTNLNVSGTLTVAGQTSLNGNVTVGDASADALTFNSSGWTLANNVSITGTWASLGTVTTADINGGTIDGTIIGGGTAAAGTFTTATATTGNITTVNATTVDSTNLEVTNLKAKDGTNAGSIADSTGVVTLNSVNALTVNIDGGTIDATTIGGSSPAAGTFTVVSAASAVFAAATITSFNTTTIDVTNLEVANIKAKDGTASITIDDVTGKVNATTVSAASANLAVAAVTTLNATSLVATSASAASINAAVALVTTGTVTNLTSTAASIASANVGTAVLTSLTVTSASIASLDVAGTVTATGLTFPSEGDTITFNTSSSPDARIKTGDSVFTNSLQIEADNGVVINYGQDDTATTPDNAVISRGSTYTKAAEFGSNGDISFYEDTGTTAGFFWDASASALGIGTNAPIDNLDVYGGVTLSTVASYKVTGADSTTTQAVFFGYRGGDGDKTGTAFRIRTRGDGANNADKAFFDTLDTERFSISNTEAVFNEPGNDIDFRIESDTVENALFVEGETGRVGIGTNDPIGDLHVLSSTADSLIQVESTFAGGDARLGLTANSAGVSQIRFGDESSGNVGLLTYSHTDDSMAFRTNTADRMTIDSSGNVGIGTSSPNDRLHVYDATANIVANFESGDPAVYISFKDDTTTDYEQIYLGAVGNDFVVVNGTPRFYINSSGNVGIGTSTPDTLLDIAANNTGLSSDTPNNVLRFTDIDTSVGTNQPLGKIEWYTRDATSPSPRVVSYILSSAAGTTGGGDIRFGVSTNAGTVGEAARIDSSGNFVVGTTENPSTLVTTSTQRGVGLDNVGFGVFTRDSAASLYVNRLTNDGTLVEFRQAGTAEGTVSVSGSTVSYNAFAGSHWSQLQDGSKPDILRGTVMESINELCEWPDETNERLPKCKISDTAGSKKVYGVFMAWDNDWETTNDMYVTAVGAFICRVNASVTVQEGDLLESNGDGTARVQADDIIRSSTIGKVTSTVKTHEYDDGSYCVPTVLYCG